VNLRRVNGVAGRQGNHLAEKKLRGGGQKHRGRQ
jgi:hypothetical protein